MALQASASGELRGALGRLGYLCAGGGKAMFVAAADHSTLPVPSRAPQTIGDWRGPHLGGCDLRIATDFSQITVVHGFRRGSPSSACQ